MLSNSLFCMIFAVNFTPDASVMMRCSGSGTSVRIIVGDAWPGGECLLFPPHSSPNVHGSH